MADSPDTVSESGAQDGERVRPRLHADHIIAAAVVAFCAVVFYLTTRFEEVPPVLAQGMQPADFPRLLLVFILLLTGVMVVQSWGKRDAVRTPLPAVTYQSVAAMLVFLAIARWVDLFLAMFVFCFGLALLWGSRRYVPILVFAAAVPAFVYILFGVLLEVRFPRGVLTNLVC